MCLKSFLFALNYTDGILLLEANRMLRAGGYFVWAAQPVYKHEDNLQEQWKGLYICWKKKNIMSAQYSII